MATLVMPKESFLFVPYHAGHHPLADVKLTNSDARSHAAAVSRQRRDYKRLRAQLGLQNLSTFLPSSAQVATSITEESTNDTAQTPADEPQHVCHGEKRVQRRQQMRSMQFSWRAGNVSADVKLTGGFRNDPFTPGPTDDFTRAAKDYFMQIVSPVNQAIYAIFNVTNIYTSYWMTLMEDEDYLPMGVAMVGAIMQRICNPSSKSTENVRSNHAIAISRLQKKYNAALDAGEKLNDDISIITVLGLANFSRFQGDNKAYGTHRKSMKAMVSSRGGLDALGHDGLVAASVSQWDSFWALGKDGTPLFSESRPSRIPVYPAFPLSEDLRATFNRLPLGYQSLVLKGKISVELIDVLGRITEAGENGVQSLSPGNLWHSETRKYRDFLEACPALATTESDTNTFERTLNLALILYCATAFTSARSNTTLFGAARLEVTRLLLSDIEALCSQPEKECLYWICAVAVDSWRQNAIDSPLLAKGMDLLHVLKRLRQEVSPENVLERFFFTQELLECCNRYLDIPD